MKRPVSLRGARRASKQSLLKDCLTSLAMTLVCTTISFASPPTSITLTYNFSKGSLHVEAVHPSFNLDKSYVRLMNVYLNGVQVSTLNYFRQNDYNEFTDDVPLTAQAGDIIRVELFCTLGGDMTKDLTVIKPEETPPNQSAGAGTNAEEK